MKHIASATVGLFYLIIISIFITPLASAEPNHGSSDFSKLTPELAKTLTTSPEEKVFKIIVGIKPLQKVSNRIAQLKDSTKHHLIMGRISAAQERVLANRVGGHFEIISKYRIFYGFSAWADKEAISDLVRIPNVLSIELMPKLKMMDDGANLLTRTNDLHNLGFTGDGITIAIIDDAIDHDNIVFGGDTAWPNHPKIIGGWDVADNDNNPTVNEFCIHQDHGTSVAGVAAGNGGEIKGAAPDAKIFFVKMFRDEADDGNCGKGYTHADVLEAIGKIIENRTSVTPHIKIINMSFGVETYSGDSASCSEQHPKLADSLLEAQQVGMTIFAASGNEGYGDKISAPACMPGVISVGEVYNSSDWLDDRCPDIDPIVGEVRCTSNSAGILDILAPGYRVITANLDFDLPRGFSGTSAASPMAAGAAASLLQAANELGESLTPADIRDILVETGVPVTDPKNNLTKPRIDLYEALVRLGASKHPFVKTVDYSNEVDTDISVTFSEPMKTGQFNDNIVISGSSSGIHQVSTLYYVQSRILKINPLTDFSPDETVTVTLNTGIQDISGNPLDGDSDGDAGPAYVISFQSRTSDSVKKAFTASEDTYIAEGNPTFHFHTLDHMRVREAANDTFGLIKFDLDTIPEGSEVESVELELNFSYVVGDLKQVFFTKVNSSWTDSEVTWSTQPDIGSSLLWYSVTGLGIQSIKNNPALTNLVEGWVNGTESNYGIYLIPSSVTDNFKISSREDSSSYRPKLIVTYKPPPPPDLIVASFGPTPTPVNNTYHVGDSVIWDVTVKNTSGGPADSSQVGYYLGNSPGDLSTPLSPDPTDGISALNVGETESEHSTYVFAASDMGQKYLISIADNRNEIDESNNDNNRWVYGPFNVVPNTPVSITSFTTSPATILEGESTTLQWTTVNAASCSASGGGGGWDGSVAVNGAQAVSLTAEGTYTFTLECNGVQGDLDSATAVVTVVGGGCGTPPLSGTVQDWDDVWQNSFHLPINESRWVSIQQRAYYSVEFNTGTIQYNATIKSLDDLTTVEKMRLGSISECPGDFNVPPECKHQWGDDKEGIDWSTNGKPGACQLQSNTTYYFNITYTDGFDPGSSTCDEAECQINIAHVEDTVTSPNAVTNTADPIGQTSATLNGTADPNGYNTVSAFQWGPTVDYGSTTSSFSAGSGLSPAAYGKSVNGLSCGETYHFRAVAQSIGGTDYGSDVLLSTLACVDIDLVFTNGFEEVESHCPCSELPQWASYLESSDWDGCYSGSHPDFSDFFMLVNTVTQEVRFSGLHVELGYMCGYETTSDEHEERTISQEEEALCEAELQATAVASGITCIEE